MFSYLCSCRTGYVDVSSNSALYPGRVCNKLDKVNVIIGEENLDSCDATRSGVCGANAVCSDRKSKGEYVCECIDGAIRYYDGQCRRIASCQSDADCDKNALCANVLDSYICQCRPGFFDISPDPETKPGRECKERMFLNFHVALKIK